MKNIYFYCIVSEDQVNLADMLKKSLLKFGYKLNILQIYDSKLKNLSKIYNFNDYLQKNRYDDDDVIVLTDAFDVVYSTDPSNLLDFLISNNKDICISSENMFGPNFTFIKEYYDKLSKSLELKSNKYPNSGVIFGKANKVKLFYNNLSSSMQLLQKYFPPEAHTKNSDQAHIISYLYEIDYINYKDILILVDVENKIVFTNTLNDVPYNINDYVFIHTWGIHIKEPHYKHIRDHQLKKWNDINKKLEL